MILLSNDKPLIIVLSRNYSTGLGVIRSLGSAGYTVDLIASVKKKGSSVIAASSKYVRKTIEVISPKIQVDRGEELIDVLMEYAGKYKEKIVLFPTDDFTTLVVDANRDRLKDYFVIPEIISEENRTIKDLMDKTIQSEIAKECGLKTPLEWIVPINEDICIPSDMVYPCFVKPITSNSGHKTEMAVCDNEGTLTVHLHKMKAFFSERSVLIQEFLNIDKEYDLAGVCLDQEVILPAVIEKRHIAGYERGVGMSGKVLPIEILGDTIEKIKAMLRKYHYVGMFDIDLNMCGGDIYFGEVNLRSGGLNFAYFLGGSNLPDIYVKNITGREVEGDANLIRTGHTFVYEKVAWEDRIHKHISRKQLKRYLREADYTLLNTKEDPKPGKMFNRRIKLSLIKNRLKDLLYKDIKHRENESVKSNADVIVTGRNYCNILTMARALGRAGYSVEVLRVFKTRPNRLNMLRLMRPESFSKYVSKYSECVADNTPYKIVESLKMIADQDKMQLLIPVDDYLVGVVDEFLDKLKDSFVIPTINNKSGEINKLMDKNRQKLLAGEFGLPILKSVLIRCNNGQYDIPEGIDYPCFIKPNISMNSTKAGMMKCSNISELEKALSQLSVKGDFEILAEDFADIKAEYSLLGVSFSGKTISPCLFKAIEGGHKERKGVAMVGKTISHSGFEEIIDQCNSFIDTLGYDGMFDVDFIETHDGSIYFIEINLRAGASMHAFTEADVNLAGILADAFLKDIPVNTETKLVETDKLFVSEKILMEEFARGDVSRARVKQIMQNTDICFVKDEIDPKPYKYFKRFYFVAAAMRIIYGVRSLKNGK